MAEPFKNLLDTALIRACGAALVQHERGFDRRRFERLALRELETLEMKARAMQIADALEATLPPRFDDACALIESTLAAPVEVDGVAAARDDHSGGLAGWIVWPLGEFVARRGIAEPQRALQALHALTQRLTAEYAIRPLIVAHPQLVFETLMRWTRDPSAHVRRLCSEGSRPRLPWGLRLQSLVADPSPTLAILAALQDDESAYVRRSVANHLNDIAKDHPARVVDWVQRHRTDATPERRALLLHASRTLIKQGHAPMLALWDAGEVFSGECTLRLAPRRVAIGGHVELTLSLRSTSRRAQSLLIDYAVHHVKADGSLRAKVFKGWKLALAPGEVRTLVRKHSLRPITTRRYHAGEHAIDISINGRVVATAQFSLQ